MTLAFLLFALTLFDAHDLTTNVDHVISLDIDSFSSSGVIGATRVAHANVPKRASWDSYGPVISARSAVVVDKKTGVILWSKNANQTQPIASISKLMSVLVFLDFNIPLDTKAKFESSDDAEDENKFKYFFQNEETTIHDLLYLALLPSDNNAINVLMRSTGKTKEEFIELMNTKAQSLGMTSTQFLDPTGLSDGNISSAKDVSILLLRALSIPLIEEISSSSEYTITLEDTTLKEATEVGDGVSKKVQMKKRRIFNTNQALGSFLTLMGGKTGHTEEAGYCLTVEAMIPNADDSVIVTVLGAETSEVRFNEAEALAEWAMRTYIWNYD